MGRLMIILVAAFGAMTACSNKNSDVTVVPGDITGLTERSFLDNHLKVAVPADFWPMDDERVRLKYPLKQGPLLVLTDAAGSVNIAIEHTQDALTESTMAPMAVAIE